MYVPIDDISHTGVIWKDSLPLTTMVFCMLPLYATLRKGLPFQFFWASTSCTVASIYHYMIYQEISTVFGMNVDNWRSFDVIIACYCLAISLAYLIHANHVLIHVLTRGVAPLLMLAMYMQGAELLTFAKVLIANSVVVVFGRLVFKTDTVPVYDMSYWKYALPCTVLGLIFFPLPVGWPHMYWLFHSLWHVFIGLALFTCYGFLHTGTYRSTKIRAKKAA